MSALTVPFSGGLDLSSPEHLVSPPFLRRADNVYLTDEGSLRKRKGSRSLSREKIDGGQLASGQGITTYDDQLLASDGSTLHTLGSFGWQAVGALPAVDTSTRRLWPGAFSQRTMAYARNGPLEFVAYEDERNDGIRCAMMDASTGAYLLSDQILLAGRKGVRIAQGPTYALVFSVDPTTRMLYCAPLTWSRQSLLGVERPLLPLAQDDTWPITQRFATYGDVHGVSAVMVTDDGSLRLVAARLGSDGRIVAQAEAPGTLSVGSLSLAHDPASPTNLAVASGSTGITIRIFDVSTGAVSSVLSQSLGTVVSSVGVAWDNGTPLTVANYVSATGGGRHGLAAYKGSQILGPLRVMHAASVPFVSDGRWYMFATTPTYSTTPTYFLAEFPTGRPLARWFPGNADAVQPSTLSVPRVDAGKIEMPLKAKVSVRSEAGGVTAHTLFFMARAEPSATGLNPARLGGTLLFPGSIPMSYDGASLAEHGHLLPPTIRSAAPTNGAALPKENTYTYVAVWEHMDASGQMHRSAPSTPQVLSFPAFGQATFSGFIAVDTQPLTRRDSAVLAVYRAAQASGTYHRVSSYSTPTVNDRGAWILTITDDVPEAELLGREILYSVGGELENDPPPACSVVTASRTRFFVGGGGEQSDSVFFSKASTRANAASFSLLLERRIPSPAGPVTALAAMENRIVAFKKNAILTWTGSGPAPNGLNDDFSPTVLLTDQLGCDNQSSVFVDDREGVYFQGAGGLWLLTRSLELVRVGAPVAPLTTDRLTSAAAVPGEGRIRFGTGDGPIIYHQRILAPYAQQAATGQWTRYVGLSQNDATIWRGAYTWIAPNGRVATETDEYHDDGDPYTLCVTTAWLRAGPVLGTATFGEAALCGQRRGPHALSIGVALDYREAIMGTVAADTSKALATTEWGESPYGKMSWGGAFDGSYIFRVQTPRRVGTCNAIRFEFRDLSTTEPLRDSFSLDALTLIAAPEDGLARVRPQKVLG